MTQPPLPELIQSVRFTPQLRRLQSLPEIVRSNSPSPVFTKEPNSPRDTSPESHVAIGKGEDSKLQLRYIYHFTQSS
jgi:hypothetical protein